MKILFGVLNWGLGHATRSIPIIEELLAHNHQISVASDGEALDLLKQNFPNLEFYKLPSLNIQYSSFWSASTSIVFQIPKIITHQKNDKLEIDKILLNQSFDLIISDNRYGFFSKNVKSIFIGHQLRFLNPFRINFIDDLFFKLHLNYLKLFAEVWIPDYENSVNLSGKLSHHPSIKVNLKVKFIGCLSRIHKSEMTVNSVYEIVFLLSGPEPQRSIFEAIAINQALKSNKKVLIIRGSNSAVNFTNENLHFINYANQNQLTQYLCSDALIICRSGYSSLMDLVHLQKTAVVVPTPGQTEQEYLADLHHHTFIYKMKQNTFNLTDAILGYKNLRPLNIDQLSLLKNAIEDLTKGNL